jgi:hypothetical protein
VNIVFTPQIHSGKILKQLLIRKKSIIWGEKGTGKSYAYFLAKYLADFVIRGIILERKMIMKSKNEDEEIKFE